MVDKIKIAFRYFNPFFTFDNFTALFPFITTRFEVTVVNDDPDILFYSVFKHVVKDVPTGQPWYQRGRIPYSWRMPEVSGNFVRVFLTEENCEPIMNTCDFAISSSVLVTHRNHLRLPNWVINGDLKHQPQMLVKSNDTDWERIAAEKTKFCNFIYYHEPAHRSHIFDLLHERRFVDAPAWSRHNIEAPPGWPNPYNQGMYEAKLAFIQKYRFTLAIENGIWPGYHTEKLVHPMWVNSIPIYVGDPLARQVFNTKSYIDITDFHDLQEMLDFVIALETNPKRYADMLAQPWYRDNEPPDYTNQAKIVQFFDRIVDLAQGRR